MQPRWPQVIPANPKPKFGNPSGTKPVNTRVALKLDLFRLYKHSFKKSHGLIKLVATILTSVQLAETRGKQHSQPRQCTCSDLADPAGVHAKPHANLLHSPILDIMELKHLPATIR